LTHRCYALALTDGFTFLNQQRRVVPICTEVSVGVLDDNKLSIADQSTTGIDHPPSGRCLDRLPRLAVDQDAGAAARATAEFHDNLTRGRPSPWRWRLRRDPRQRL